MTDEQYFLKNRGLSESEIADVLDSEYVVKPTGLDDFTTILKDDAVEIVAYYKMPLEDALGQFADKAKKNGNVYEYFGTWEDEFEQMIGDMKDYGSFMKSAMEYTRAHGILKAEWR